MLNEVRQASQCEVTIIIASTTTSTKTTATSCSCIRRESLQVF